VARIRTIKPAFWSDPAVGSLTRDARLLLVGLFSFADDDGRFLASINAINGYIYPYDDLPPAKVRKWLSECVESGIVHLYKDAGLDYGCIPNWHKHQVINRYTPSPLPAPDIEWHPRSSSAA
jgi:hypothetical protein